MMRLSTEGYQGLRALVVSRLGLVLPLDGRASLERKLLPVLRRYHFAGFSEFELHLRYGVNSDAAWEDLIEAVTVHETYFFRSPQQFETLAQDVLPRVLAPGARCDVWSVACATGEEVYSLAIALERCGALKGEFRVFGTDISPASIRAARRGVFGENSFRELQPEKLFPHVRRTGTRPSFFDARQHELWEVAPEMRAKCIFATANVLEPAEVPFFDVRAAFCRNLLIYLDTGARRKVLDLIFDRLIPGGILVLGPSETLMPEVTSFELLPVPGELVYRKPG